MVKLGDLIYKDLLPIKYSFHKGDLILFNICFVKHAFDILLTGKITTIDNQPRKLRPIVIYEIINNVAYFIALSISEKFPFMNSSEFEFIKEKCGKFDLINFCGRCNLKYLNKIVNLIEKFHE